MTPILATPMRILIADDEITSRAVLMGILQEGGYETVECADGQEAWDLLRQPGAPELVILDWIMPEMDGLDVLRRVREIQADRPPYVIMVTDKTDRASIVTALDAGANDYVSKPFDAAELHARVNVGRRMIDMQETLVAKVAELRRALDQIKTLRGIVPICANCKKIRDDRGYWQQVETYVRAHSEAQFSHGICPECTALLYPELVDGQSKGEEEDIR